jgi:hypothetical protein
MVFNTTFNNISAISWSDNIKDGGKKEAYRGWGKHLNIRTHMMFNV